jgi:hypothetical protein
MSTFGVELRGGKFELEEEGEEFDLFGRESGKEVRDGISDRPVLLVGPLLVLFGEGFEE